MLLVSQPHLSESSPRGFCPSQNEGTEGSLLEGASYPNLIPLSVKVLMTSMKTSAGVGSFLCFSGS